MAGRGICTGAKARDFDMQLGKNWKIKERYGIKFSFDFFNIFNHTNFADPAVTDIEAYLASPTNSPFGKIVSTVGNPRLIQFSLRWAF